MPRTSPSPIKPVSSLLNRLQSDFPAIRFTLGNDDHWDAHETITYTADTPACSLLHELAHALLEHREYDYDIELLAMERSAWDYARRTLAPRYGVTITSDDADDALDTYRDWLHNRSLCPGCSLSGLQLPDQSYRCVACRTTWRASPAKTRALRRFRLTTI